MGPLRVATRASALARWQAGEVARLLRLVDPGLDVELVITDTVGDRRLDVAITELGGQGVFVKEVQAAVLDGRADLAVHSAKDLPSLTAPGLHLIAVPTRGDPRDALVGAGWDDLGPGAVVATGSVRRRAQLAWLRPDLSFVGLRGNIATRLDRCPPGGAVVVAAAALERLGMAHRAHHVFSPSVLLPQVGQGAMAVECRGGDRRVAELLADIDDPLAHRAVDAERGFLARLGSGCDLPVGAWATVDGDTIRVEAMVASIDGHVLLKGHASGPACDPAALGASLADRLVVDAGGAALLEDGFVVPAHAQGVP
ncbi:MAG: hydroxymethylbilane synthase [Actinomycetota bacterium]|nr:hydroxymethylbilane synthase [Actinomycetota bacterium]